MTKLKVRLNSINAVTSFVETIQRLPYDADIGNNSRVFVDAASIMGIFSLNLQLPLYLIVYSDDTDVIKRALAAFIIN